MNGYRLGFVQNEWLRKISYHAEDAKVFEVWSDSKGAVTLHNSIQIHLGEARVALDIMEKFELIWHKI